MRSWHKGQSDKKKTQKKLNVRARKYLQGRSRKVEDSLDREFGVRPKQKFHPFVVSR